MKLKDRLACIQFILNRDTHYLNLGYPKNEDQKLLNYEYKLGADVFTWNEDAISNLSDIELLELVIRLSDNISLQERKSQQSEEIKNNRKR